MNFKIGDLEISFIIMSTAKCHFVSQNDIFVKTQRKQIRHMGFRWRNWLSRKL